MHSSTVSAPLCAPRCTPPSWRSCASCSGTTRLAVVATCHDLLHPAGAGPAAQGVRGAGHESLWAHREVLPMAWQDLVTHRLLLRRLPGGSGEACFASRWLGGEDMPLAFGVAEGCVLRA